MAFVCIDASFTLAIVLGDALGERAYVTWRRELLANSTFVVPPLFYAETTSVIRGRVYTGALSQSRAESDLADVLALPLTLWTDTELLQRTAFQLATRFNRPKAYDAQYLAVAQLLGCELWTADERMYNAVREELPWVKWIGAAA